MSTKHENPYLIRWSKFADGERMPFLVQRSMGLPIEAPTYWITSHRRAVGMQPNTLFNELRSVMLLYLWADLRGIDVVERITEGKFLSLAEIIDLVNVCGWFLDDVLAALERRQSNVITIGRKSVGGVQSGEKRNRLNVIRSFLEFTSADHLSRLQAWPDRWALYRDMRDECINHLATYTRAIPAPNRDDVGRRQGLDPEVLLRLRAVIDPDHPENPFEPQVRFRNYMMVRLLMDLGIRRGELLGIKVSDCDVVGERGFITIHRRPDDVDDPRMAPVATKTAARTLELSPRNTRIVHEWIVHHRSKLLRAVKSKGQFLIVTIPTGEPMSPSNVTKMFDALRERVPGLPADVKPHVLRHSWNDSFSLDMDRLGVAEEDEVRFRKRLMGWRSEKTAGHYLRRTVSRRSNEVLRDIHGNLDIRIESEGQKR